MNFWNHLNTARPFDLKGLSQGTAERFSSLLGLGHSVADLLGHYSDEFGHLPVETLRGLAQAHRLYQVWNKRRGTIEQARQKASLPAFPKAIYTSAPRPDQLDAIVRAARVCPRKEMENEEAWLKVLHAGVNLWTRCMDLCRKEGTVRSEALNLEDPRATANYEGYVRDSEGLDGIPPHRWLAMRRGAREGVLKLSMELPDQRMEEAVELVKGQLGPPAQERELESLISELVMDDLHPWLLSILDADAQQQATRAAADSLAGMLRSAPVQARKLGAIYFTRPGAPVALVVADREGDPESQRVIKAEDKWEDKAASFLEEQGVQHVVVPASAVDGELLASLEQKLMARLTKLQLVKVRPAALAEARAALTAPPLRLRSVVASALVLARRALDPLREWSLVDPVSIGVAEYQHDLNTDLLRASLRETCELCRLERRRGKRVHMGVTQTRGNAVMAKLNNMVRTISDLKSGMTLHGMVTNISHFGAFINIGLAQEALVHISELSDSFVSNPNEVVSIGQQVTARVLAVEPARGRISLTLKTHSRQLQDGGSRHGGGGGPGRGGDRAGGGKGPPMSKSEALANLEKLFKK